MVKGVKVVSRQPVNNNKECIVSLCREKNGMLKIYLDGEEHGSEIKEVRLYQIEVSVVE